MGEVKTILNKIGKNITKTSASIIKKTKLSIKISSEESKLEEKYIEIGKKVQEIYAYGGNLGKFFDEKYLEILEIEKNITEIKEKIEDGKEEKIYNPQVNPNKSIEQDDIIEEIVSKICPVCDEQNEPTSRFCLKCGRNI